MSATQKQIFVPGFFTHAVAVEMFGAEPSLELLWGLPDAGRTYETANLGSRDGLTEIVTKRLNDYLPTIHALHAMGVGGPLRIDAELMDRAPNLEVVFIQAAGADSIDVQAATDRGIVVLNAPGANALAVAEHAWSLILNLTRHIGPSIRNVFRTGESSASPIYAAPVQPTLLHGKTLGLIGLGYVGKAVAQIARFGFGMSVIAHDPFADPAEAERMGVKIATVDEVLSHSDVVSLHAPLTNSTKQIIDAEALARMRHSAYLVNTSRGGLVDTDALAAAVDDGTIAGAGLDVTDPEPLRPGHPLLQSDNVVLTPHVASLCEESKEATARISTELVLQALSGQRPRQLLNPAVWPNARARQH